MLIPTINLAVVDDHLLFRKLLVDFLSKQKNIRVAHESSNALDLIEKLRETSIDIVLLDLFIPKLSGIDAVSIIHNQFPHVKIIVVSLCTDLKIVASLLEFGVFGYLSKEEDPENLLKAIFFASENRIFRNSLFTEALYLSKEKSVRKDVKDLQNFLTEREKKIIQLLWEEKTNKEIASEIYLSISSVEKVKQELKEKLGVKTIVGLFKFALLQGFISIHNNLTIR